MRMIRAHRPPGARIGTVLAGATTVAVRDTTIPVALAAVGLSMAAGDKVLLVPAAGTWVVVAKVTQSVTPAYPTTTLTTPPNGWWFYRAMTGAGTWGGWVVYGGAAGTDFTAAAGYQGRTSGLRGAGDATVSYSPMTEDGSCWYWPLAAMIPSGATLVDVSLRLRRAEWRDDFAASVNGQPTVAPRIYAHSFTPAAPPTNGVDLPSRPAFASGFGPLTDVPAAARGETVSISLPASWVTAWLAGTITGLGIWSDQPADFLYLDSFNPAPVELAVTYTTPTDPEAA
jgi:hypothetical protein